MNRIISPSLLLRFIASLILLSPLGACSAPRMWQAVEDHVVDWETKGPIEGAVLVAMWDAREHMMMDAAEICYHVENATTDVRGYFKLPGYSDGNMSYVEKSVDISLYKAGYVDYVNPEGYIQVVNGVHYLVKDTRPTKQRMEYLARMSAHASCGSKDGSEKSLLVMQRAVYQEAIQIAASKEERFQVINILQELERVEIGSDISWENWRKRKMELK